MKIGLFTDALGDRQREKALDWVAEAGIEAVEIGTGNFSSAPHCDLQALLQEPVYRRRFLGDITSRGLSLSALNCSGNPLDPHPARRQAQEVLRDTLRAASELGVDTVITMSGCPGDPEGGTYPNWVTCTWQPEYLELLEHQWDEVISPFWEETGRFARDQGVRIAIEPHPGQAAYNTRTLLRLREIAGPETLGANLDPSHLFFQNIDPLLVVDALGADAIFHVHAKDTRINQQEMALNGSLDTRPMGRPNVRSWEYVTLGDGHPEGFWQDFVVALRDNGYEGVLSIEHEDPSLDAEDGIRRSVSLLQSVLHRTTAEPLPRF